MKLREFALDDYEEVVDMYYKFNTEVYGNFRKIGSKYFYYKEVIEWVRDGKHIILAINNKNTIVGFSLCFIDDFNGLTEPIYNCGIAYVKPAYRNTRASYLLYNNGYAKAKELNMSVYSSARLENNVDKLMSKHFNLQPKFMNMEGKSK